MNRPCASNPARAGLRSSLGCGEGRPVVREQFSEPIHGMCSNAREHIAETGERLDAPTFVATTLINTAAVLPPWSLPKKVQLPRIAVLEETRECIPLVQRKEFQRREPAPLRPRWLACATARLPLKILFRRVPRRGESRGGNLRRERAAARDSEPRERRRCGHRTRLTLLETRGSAGSALFQSSSATSNRTR